MISEFSTSFLALPSLSAASFSATPVFQEQAYIFFDLILIGRSVDPVFLFTGRGAGRKLVGLAWRVAPDQAEKAGRLYDRADAFTDTLLHLYGVPVHLVLDACLRLLPHQLS